MRIVSRWAVCLGAWLGAWAVCSGAAAADATGQTGKASDHAIVAGFERFHAPGKDDPVEWGRLLLGELGCIACHSGNPGIEAKRGPVLDAVGARVRPEYFPTYLADPHRTKPGTTMPDVLRGLPEAQRRETILALTHLLASTGGGAEASPNVAAIGRGRSLYERIGCLACHDPLESGAQRFATSVPLGDLARKYTLAGLTGFLSDPLKARPSGRMPGLGLKGDEAGDLASYLLRELRGSAPPNVAYRYYEGEWQKLPDFARLSPRAVGQAVGFDVSTARRQDHCALVFDGYLRIEGAGEYTFYLQSDDGSRLVIDDHVAIDNDGVHPVYEKTAKLLLSKGVHRLALEAFNVGGEFVLDLEYSSARMSRRPVVPSLASTDGPAAKATGSSRVSFVVDPSLAAKGRTLFSRLGCASCHQLRSGNRALESTLKATPLGRLAPRGGCLDGTSPKAPAYHLSDAQRQALAAAIRSLSGPPAPAPTARQIVARTLTAFNCYACHERDKVGGVEGGRNEFFTTTQKEMGDEGRLPPRLDGVGAKLSNAYMSRVLNEGAKDRPYMHARMPRFGAGNVGKLAGTLAELDPVVPVAAVTFDEPLRRVKSDGRFLAGGQALGCIKCHTFKGIETEGVQAIDMVTMTTRLRRDWFHRYLLDPQAYRPGTRMPASWPMGQSLLPKVLGGDTHRQIEAIWQFLADGQAAVEPYGLGREPIPIVPEGEAVIYRNFIRGAGPRGIAVGLPEKVNYAFDANEMRLAMIWQGAFIDASRHWTGRGDGFQGPLGDNILNFPTGPSLARLATGSDPWPAAPPRTMGCQFRGYQLQAHGRPAFRYEIGPADVVDSIDPVPGTPSAGLRRTLTLSADPPPSDLWLRAVSADKIEPGRQGRYTIDGEWTLTIKATAEPVVRKSAGKVELLVPVVFTGNEATIVEEFAW